MLCLHFWLRHKTGGLYFLLIITGLYILLFAESLLLINFTRSTVLVSGSSLMMLFTLSYFGKKNSGLRFVAFLAIFISLLMRWEAAVLTITCSGLLLVLLKGKTASLSLFRSIRMLIIALVAGIFTCLFFNNRLKTPDNRLHFELRPHVNALLDYHGYAPLKSSDYPGDRIRTLALLSWYYQDEVQINKNYFERTYQANPGIRNRIQSIVPKLRGEWKKISGRRELYNQGLLLHVKLLGALLIWILFTLAASGSVAVGIMSCVAIGTCLLIACVFFKYEDRLFFPLLSCLILVSVMLISESRWSKLLRFAGLLLLGAALLRAEKLKSMAAEKAQEYRVKILWKSRLQEFARGKIVLFDLYSMCLNPDAPFRESATCEDMKWSVFGDLHYYETQSHRQYLQKIAGPFRNQKEFYQNAAKNDRIVFVMADFRREILTAYLQELWQLPLEFTPLHQQYGLDQIRWSYIWTPLGFSYCRLLPARSKATLNLD